MPPSMTTQIREMENEDWCERYIQLERKTIRLERQLYIKTMEHERTKKLLKTLMEETDGK